MLTYVFSLLGILRASCPTTIFEGFPERVIVYLVGAVGNLEFDQFLSIWKICNPHYVIFVEIKLPFNVDFKNGGICKCLSQPCLKCHLAVKVIQAMIFLMLLFCICLCVDFKTAPLFLIKTFKMRYRSIEVSVRGFYLPSKTPFLCKLPVA